VFQVFDFEKSMCNFAARLFRAFFFVALTTVLAFFSGCHRSPYTVAPVHGKVTVDDKPVTQATLMFAPISSGEETNPGKPAFGTIESDGVYHLTTFAKNDGAVIGDHWVTILGIKNLPEGIPEFDRLSYPTKIRVSAGHDNEVDIKLTTALIKKLKGDNR
jgi:hypothetical protein